MRIIVDENVSYSVVLRLKEKGHKIISIAKESKSALDKDVFRLALREEAILITRDYHFTNPTPYPPDKTSGIIYIRIGNLRSDEEVEIVERFFADYLPEQFKGKLVTLYKKSIRIR
ncbi:MAG: hypothetical protein DDT40_01492 [candidate division WS2 bacterium]|nr:hypothetical protein [Candidatus Psychracetigena formicireducens]